MAEVLENNLFNKIGSLKKSFTDSEKKILDCIQKNPEKVISMSIKELSNESNTGEATIIRFCKKIGFKGYNEFKISLISTMSKKKQKTRHKIDILSDKNYNTIAENIYNNSFNVLKDTLSLINNEVFDNCINLINTAKHIEFIGVGYSNLTAQDAKYKFLRIGKSVAAHSDSHLFKMAASISGKNDLVIGISQTGETQEVIESMKSAKARGADTIVITNNDNTEITKYADHILVNGYNDVRSETGSFSERISQLFIIELLYLGVLSKNKDKALQLKDLTIKAVT
ncbi:MAG: MurR/RpiR family transcriptional regulator [Sebaldella sp.]|nr:MurR/RpiR family transcriptional regulator [Sebaldella sp.]